MKIKAVLFDLDGTLLDRDTSLANFIRDQYDRFQKLQAVDKETYAARFIELDNHGYVWKDIVYQTLIEEFNIKGLNWEDLLQDYIENFHNQCIGFPNLLEMLTILKNKGLKMALVSNGFGQFQYDNFQALGISQFFNEVLVSEWEGVRKPDPEIFKRALTKLGVTSDEAMFVGDHPINDVQASRNLGMKAVWKQNEPISKYSQDVDADAVIHDLLELEQYV